MTSLNNAYLGISQDHINGILPLTYNMNQIPAPDKLSSLNIDKYREKVLKINKEAQQKSQEIFETNFHLQFLGVSFSDLQRVPRQPRDARIWYYNLITKNLYIYDMRQKSWESRDIKTWCKTHECICGKNCKNSLPTYDKNL